MITLNDPARLNCMSLNLAQEASFLGVTLWLPAQCFADACWRAGVPIARHLAETGRCINRNPATIEQKCDIRSM